MSARGEIDLTLEILESVGGWEDLPRIREFVEQCVIARQQGRRASFTVHGGVEAARASREDEARKGNSAALK